MKPRPSPPDFQLPAFAAAAAHRLAKREGGLLTVFEMLMLRAAALGRRLAPVVLSPSATPDGLASYLEAVELASRELGPMPAAQRSQNYPLEVMLWQAVSALDPAERERLGYPRDLESVEPPANLLDLTAEERQLCEAATSPDNNPNARKRAELVLALAKPGATTVSAGADCGVSRQYAAQTLQMWREQGTEILRAMKPGRKPKSAG